MKTCCRCKQDLPLDDFGINKAFRDGKNAYCKKCNRERMQKVRALQRAGIVRKPKKIKPMLTELSVSSVVVDKVESAILLGYGTWRTLRRNTRLSEDEIGEALVELMFYKRSVRPRTINGERVYVRRAA